MLAGDVLESRIRSDSLVSPFRREAFRGSSYELLTGKIVRADAASVSLFDDGVGGDTAEIVSLAPREVVTIVSREIVRCPDDMTYVTDLSANLTDGGLIAVGAPIVEPGYEGPVAVTVMNLSPAPKALSLKDPFLRMRFFAHDKVREAEAVKLDHSEFLAQTKARLIERAPALFVDYAAVEKAAVAAARDEVKRATPSFLIFLAAGVAVVSLAATAGFAYLALTAGASL